MINITLPDGNVKKVKKGTSALDIAIDISEGLARNVLSASVNNEIWDANRPILEDSSLKLHTWKDDEGKSTFLHSSAHIMAEALESLYLGLNLVLDHLLKKGFIMM